MRDGLFSERNLFHVSRSPQNVPLQQGLALINSQERKPLTNRLVSESRGGFAEEEEVRGALRTTLATGGTHRPLLCSGQFLRCCCHRRPSRQRMFRQSSRSAGGQTDHGID